MRQVSGGNHLLELIAPGRQAVQGNDAPRASAGRGLAVCHLVPAVLRAEGNDARILLVHRDDTLRIRHRRGGRGIEIPTPGTGAALVLEEQIDGDVPRELADRLPVGGLDVGMPEGDGPAVVL